MFNSRLTLYICTNVFSSFCTTSACGLSTYNTHSLIARVGGIWDITTNCLIFMLSWGQDLCCSSMLNMLFLFFALCKTKAVFPNLRMFWMQLQIVFHQSMKWSLSSVKHTTTNHKAHTGFHAHWARPIRTNSFHIL